jgi:LmbE family N-acetylglucosaminyl deacetylase
VKVLVVAPHPDDETIGCGGLICRHVDAGDRVTAIFLTSGELGLKTLPVQEAKRTREAEALAASRVLGLAEVAFLRQPDWVLEDQTARTADILAPVLARVAPDRVLVPHPEESHPDHRAALPILHLALRGSRAEVLGYEVWTPLAEPDLIEDISASMVRKLAALRCHRSQLNDLRYDRAILGLNAYRGALMARCRYAEAYRYL